MKVLKSRGSIQSTTSSGDRFSWQHGGIDSTQVNLAWSQNPEPDLNHYNIYRGNSSGFNVTLGTTPPTGTAISNTFHEHIGLAPSTTYYYKVAAVDNFGNIGPLSSEKFIITPDGYKNIIPPAQVIGLQGRTG